MYLYRIHIRPSGGSADMATTFAYCLSHKVLGVGWRTPSGKNTTVWDDYYKEACTVHGDLSVCAYINKWIGPDDLVWTRDDEANYYLARVTSGWEYWTCKEGDEQDVDVANIFRCEMKPVPLDGVPGKVVASFRAPKSIQGIDDVFSLEYSKLLWNDLAGTTVYNIDPGKLTDIFAMIDDQETEDLVFLYLQHLGWYLVPGSRRKDTKRFEYLAINPKTGERAMTQVRTGNSPLVPADYKSNMFKVFLFQSNEIYHGDCPAGVDCLKRNDLVTFMKMAKGWLPRSLQVKMKAIKM